MIVTPVLPPLEIRRLSVADADAWARCRHQALTEHPLAFGATAPDDLASLAEIARSRVERADSAILGAFDADRLVGIVGLRREPGPKEGHKAYLWGMYVRPEARNRGVGAALLSSAIALARSWPGIARVALSVSSEAPAAEALYRRAGFVAWGREPDALRWSGESADETHMALELPV